MPYASRAQQGLFHSPNSPVSEKEVEKWDKESKGEKGLPYHSEKKGKGHEKKESKAFERKEHGGKKSFMRAKALRDSK